MELKWIRVAGIHDILPGRCRPVSPQKGEHLLVCNVGGSFYAMRDTCTHDGGMLGFGDLEGSLIECPRHGAKFDVTNGQVAAPPAVTPLQTYPVRVQGEDIQVCLDR